MNLQETIEFGIRSIVEQGVQALGGTVCKYETPEGNRCVMGHILAKEFPSLDLKYLTGGIVLLARSSESLKNYLHSFPELANLEDRHIMDFWEEFQLVHDLPRNWVSGQALRLACAGFLKCYNLDSSFLDSIDWSNVGQNKLN